MKLPARGPGLAKTAGARLFSARQTTLVRSSDPRWRELLKLADAVSEGKERSEDGRTVWYGTTSLILLFPDLPEAERAFVAAVAARDPHLRLRATRIAHREAASRAPGILGLSRCEITTQVDPRGVRIDVDVQAPLIVSFPATKGSSRD
ncbi:MAG: hypothetical protein ABIP89_20275 [Polyangiaceae bacterium]